MHRLLGSSNRKHRTARAETDWDQSRLRVPSARRSCLCRTRANLPLLPSAKAARAAKGVEGGAGGSARVLTGIATGTGTRSLAPVTTSPTTGARVTIARTTTNPSTDDRGFSLSRTETRASRAHGKLIACFGIDPRHRTGVL